MEATALSSLDGHFDGNVHGAAVSDVHDGRRRPLAARQELRDALDGLLRSGKADAHRRALEQSLEAFERKRQMSAALVVGDRVNFVHDDRFDVAQHLAALFRGQQDVQRFRRGDQNVRRPPQHGAALVHRRVAGTHGHANWRQEQAALARLLQNLAERNFEIFLDVVAERLQRGDVEHLGLVGELSCEGFAHQGVDASQKCREGFARAGRSGDDRAAASQDMRPARLLRLGGRGETFEEPLPHDGVGPIESSRSGAVGGQQVHGKLARNGRGQDLL